MPRYLRPSDVSPADRTKVLEFLNAARTAEEIAERVEIPGELDVGIRLARRILDRRDQLGGFVSLEQLDATPLIGPERFTEIVTTLSDARPPLDELEELRSEVAELRRRVTMLDRSSAATNVLELELLQQSAVWLGEPIDVVATLVDGTDGRPLPGRTVTVVTSWGRLEAFDEFHLHDGRGVTTRTDHVGRARVRLVPATEPPLQAPQAAALVDALRQLDRTAVTPAADLAGLMLFAERYRAVDQAGLRDAVDLCFRAFGTPLLEQRLAREPLGRWWTTEAQVFASAPDAASTRIRTAAALTVGFRDWLAAWLHTYRQLVNGDAGLTDRLVEVANRGEVESRFERVYAEVSEFVRKQQGWVGERVGSEVAESSLVAFTGAGLRDQPFERWRLQFAAVQNRSDALRALGPKSFRELTSVRSDLRRSATDLVGRPEFDQVLGELRGRLDDTASTDDLSTLRRETLAAVEATVPRQEIAALIDTAIEAATARRIDPVLRDLRLDLDSLGRRISDR